MPATTTHACTENLRLWEGWVEAAKRTAQDYHPLPNNAVLSRAPLEEGYDMIAFWTEVDSATERPWLLARAEIVPSARLISS